jgi:transposase-like protein
MVKPRRTYTPEFKVRVVLEMLTSKKSLSQASREYGIKIACWRWRQNLSAPQDSSNRSRENPAQRIADRSAWLGGRLQFGHGKSPGIGLSVEEANDSKV